MMLWIVGAALLGQAQPPGLPPKIDERVRASVVSIQNHKKDGQASGVIVAQSPATIFVLTAAHTFDDRDLLSVTVFIPDDIGLLRPNVLRKVDIEKRLDPYGQDLALLAVAARNVPKLNVLTLPEFVPANKPFAAFSVAVFPDLGGVPRPEEVLGAQKVTKKGKTAEFWKVKNSPELGRSGGPLIDGEGRLLGICSGGDNKAGYYTHLNEIRAFLKGRNIPFVTEPQSKKSKE